MHQDNGVSFLGLQNESIQWAKEGDRGIGGTKSCPRSCEARVDFIGDCEATTAKTVRDLVLTELLQTVKKQQDQLEVVVKTVADLKGFTG